MMRLANGFQIRVSRIGHGSTLVLLHGYPENLQVWNRLAPLLARHYEVVAFDWPGMGYSDEWPGGAAPLPMARRLRSILKALRIERPILVGMDMGGQPALTYAATFPEELDRLVVMNSLVFGDAPTSWEIQLLRKYRLNRLVLRYLPGVIFRRAESTFLPLGARLDRTTRHDFWTAFRKPRVRRFISKMCAGYQGTLPTLPSLYQHVTCPTLVVWGECDKHFPVAQATRLHDSIAVSQLKVLKQGTHWMALWQADELANAMLKWLVP